MRQLQEAENQGRFDHTHTEQQQLIRSASAMKGAQHALNASIPNVHVQDMSPASILSSAIRHDKSEGRLNEKSRILLLTKKTLPDTRIREHHLHPHQSRPKKRLLHVIQQPVQVSVRPMQ